MKNISHQKNPKIESTGVSGHPISDESEFLRKHNLKLSFPLIELNELNSPVKLNFIFVLVYTE